MNHVVCAARFSMLIDEHGFVWCFGNNQFGFLGLGHCLSQVKPAIIPNLFHVQYISCTLYHAACIDSDGYLWAIGIDCINLSNNKKLKKEHYNFKRITSIPLMKYVDCNTYSIKTIDVYGYVWSIYTTNNKIEGLENINFISCGGSHTFCLNTDGKLFCFGSNSDGQLGIDKFISDKDNNDNSIIYSLDNFHGEISSISCGYLSTMLLGYDGCIYSFGSNLHGQLGYQTNEFNSFKATKIVNIPPMKVISNGFYHSMCIDTNGDVWMCGNNMYGQCGNQTSSQQFQKVLSNHNICSLSKGGNHSIFTDINGNAWVSGWNNQGQLGIGNKDDIKDFIQPKKYPKLLYSLVNSKRIKSALN